MFKPATRKIDRTLNLEQDLVGTLIYAENVTIRLDQDLPADFLNEFKSFSKRHG